MNQRKDEMVRELQQRLEQEKDAHAIADRNGHAMRLVFFISINFYQDMVNSYIKFKIL